MIQEVKNSQNYNRYSYVLNNPLSYTDPTGYFRTHFSGTCADFKDACESGGKKEKKKNNSELQQMRQAKSKKKNGDKKKLDSAEDGNDSQAYLNSCSDTTGESCYVQLQRYNEPVGFSMDTSTEQLIQAQKKRVIRASLLDPNSQGRTGEIVIGTIDQCAIFNCNFTGKIVANLQLVTETGYHMSPTTTGHNSNGRWEDIVKTIATIIFYNDQAEVNSWNPEVNFNWKEARRDSLDAAAITGITRVYLVESRRGEIIEYRFNSDGKTGIIKNEEFELE